MKEVEFGKHAELGPVDARSKDGEQAAHHDPTPAEVLTQIGRVIVFCLGLVLLAHVIVALVGAQ